MQIDRIMEAFAKHYCRQNPNLFEETDTCYLLSFSIIMLNTALHNPNVKKKITCEQFVAQNRGINSGKDLPRDILVSNLAFFRISVLLQVQNSFGLVQNLQNLAKTYLDTKKSSDMSLLVWVYVIVWTKSNQFGSGPNLFWTNRRVGHKLVVLNLANPQNRFAPEPKLFSLLK